MHTQDPKMSGAIETVADCHHICLETINHCLSMGGDHVEDKHTKLLMDCAEICAITEHFMIRNSQFHGDVCGVCADICESCAKSCEKLGGEEMERCAKACRDCAKVCKEMA